MTLNAYDIISLIIFVPALLILILDMIFFKEE